MTEREKMLAGLEYRARDSELIEAYWRGRRVMQSFNLAVADPQRMQILRASFPAVAEGVWIEPPFHFEYGIHLSIGARTYVNVGCFLQDCGRISIGEDCLIGPSVKVCTAEHPLPAHQRVIPASEENEAHYVTSAKPVTIGDRVWLGASVTILGGVTIGDGAVIGSGSVVTKDIPAGSVAFGVPCNIQG